MNKYVSTSVLLSVSIQTDMLVGITTHFTLTDIFFLIKTHPSHYCKLNDVGTVLSTSLLFKDFRLFIE